MLAPGMPPPPDDPPPEDPPEDPPLGIFDPLLWPLDPPPLGMPPLDDEEPDEPDEPDEPPGRLGIEGPCGPWEGELELQPANVSSAHSPMPQARLRTARGRIEIGSCCIVAMFGILAFGILAPSPAHLTSRYLNATCIGIQPRSREAQRPPAAAVCGAASSSS